MFRALYLEQNIDKSTAASLRELDDDALPAFEARGVTVDKALSEGLEWEPSQICPRTSSQVRPKRWCARGLQLYDLLRKANQ